MTTIVAVRKGDRVVIAADSQSTFGDTRVDAQFDAQPDKIFQSCDSYFGISGAAAHDLVLQGALAQTENLDFHSRATIFNSFRQLHKALKQDYFLRPDEEDGDPYESSHFTALIANSQGIFGVFSMREVYEYNRFWAIGSGREFALGAMQAVYDDGEMEAEAIARLGVSVGCQFDIGSTLPMTVYCLPLEGGNGEQR